MVIHTDPVVFSGGIIVTVTDVGHSVVHWAAGARAGASRIRKHTRTFKRS